MMGIWQIRLPFSTTDVSMALVLAACAARCAAAPSMSVEDVLDGIRQRRSEIESVRVRYQVRSGPTEAGEALHALEGEKKHRLDGTEALPEQSRRSGSNAPKPQGPIASGSGEEYPPEGDLLTREQDDARERNIAARARLATKAREYAVLQRDERRFFENSEIKPGGALRALTRGAYDGEVLKRLSGKTGSIARVDPSEAIKFPTIGRLAGVNDVDLEAYLEKYRQEIAVSGVANEGGDVLITLVRRVALPVKGTGSVTRTEEIVVNVSKDFWLRASTVRIAATAPGVKQTEPTVERTDVTGYWESNDHFYPKEIKRVAFAAVPPRAVVERGTLGTWDPGVNDYKPVSETTVTVLSVELNGSIDDRELALEFPPGTRYIDKIRDGTFVVDADGTIRNMADVLGAPILPVDKVNPDEADKILRDARRSRMSSGRTNRTWIWAATLFLTCLASGFALASRLRARK